MGSKELPSGQPEIQPEQPKSEQPEAERPDFPGLAQESPGQEADFYPSRHRETGINQAATTARGRHEQSQASVEAALRTYIVNECQTLSELCRRYEQLSPTEREAITDKECMQLAISAGMLMGLQRAVRALEKGRFDADMHLFDPDRMNRHKSKS